MTDHPRPATPDLDTPRALLEAVRKVRTPLACVIVSVMVLSVPRAINPGPHPDREIALYASFYLYIVAAVFMALLSACIWAAQRAYAGLDAMRVRQKCNSESSATGTRVGTNGLVASKINRRAVFFTAGAIVFFSFAALSLGAGICRSISDDRGHLLDSDVSPDHG